MTHQNVKIITESSSINQILGLQNNHCYNSKLIIKNFSIYIYLNNSTIWLYTNRLLKQSLILLISSILGSITGAVGILGVVMSGAESLIMKIMRRKMKIGVDGVLRGRKNIDLMYFGRFYRKVVEFRNKVNPVFETNNDKLKKQSLELIVRLS